MMLINTPNIMLIGCGPHAKRVYLPILKETQQQYGTQLKVVVDIKEKELGIKQLINDSFSDVDFLFVKNFKNKYSLPKEIENQLNKFIKKYHINGVIIATDRLHHMQYALWAEKQNLHILMDKPISTYDNIANNINQAKKLITDYNLLIKNYNPKKAFIVNAQRRFLPQFELVYDKIMEVAKNYGMPVTSMQSTHCDGQWRLPNEILTIKYHPLLGWGKVSHSGYHFIDMASKMVCDSYKFAKKSFNEISVFSKFIRPSGVLTLQNQKDLCTLFGKDYLKLDHRNENELLNLYKKNNEAEVDCSSIITFSKHGIPLTNISLNLIHNGFSRRSWLQPNMNDLYKGNGRVRHEYHNIQQGCLQNIQIHSYQSNSKHNLNTEKDLFIGGNNHYDIYIFRNSELIGGKTLEIITAKDIVERENLDKNKVLNELARHEAVKQFLDVILNKIKAKDTKSNILDHKIAVQIMSLIYQSAIKNSEIFLNTKQGDRDESTKMEYII